MEPEPEKLVDYWEVFRELMPWMILLFVVLFDTWVMNRMTRSRPWE